MKRAAYVAALAIFALAATPTGSGVPTGTPLVNRASLTYDEPGNSPGTTSSNQVEAIVAALSGVSLTPNESACDAATDSFTTDRPLTKIFTLRNGGDLPDTFVVSSATASAGSVTGVAFVQGSQSFPVVVGSTRSPVVAPSGALSVVVTVDAKGVAAGTDAIVTVAVKSTAQAQNGASTARASQCGVAVAPSDLGGAGGATSAIPKLVNGFPAIAAVPGDVVTYGVAFENYGAVATGITIEDALPPAMTYVPGSAQINGIPSHAQGIGVSGQRLAIALGPLAAKQTAAVSFQATLSTQARAGQSILNVATVSVANTTLTTQPAAVLVGSANTLFDGDLGAAAPIEGASVELIADRGKGKLPAAPTLPIVLAGRPIPPNVANVDPYVTDFSGTYALGLAPKQAATYDILVGAAGYTARRIMLRTVANASGDYYSATLTALDGQPLTSPGTYDVVSGPVTLAATYGAFGNIPLFRSQNVTLSKLVDRATASAGSRLTYTLDVQNGRSPLGAATLVDALPAGVAYAPGTSRTDGVRDEPARSGSFLSWQLPSLVTEHTIVFDAVILPSVAEDAALVNVASVSAHVATSANYTVGARATATTIVVAGLFTNRTIIVGRVYLDRTGSGRFEGTDVGVPGVRIYLEDGESVTTDAEGKYDFPSTRPGLHVLRLDETSLPAGVGPFDDRRIDSESSVRRLVEDPYEGGLLQDVNFALKPLL